MTQSPGSIAAFHEFDRMSVIAIGVPLMLLAGFATHMNSRASIERQSAEAAANPQTAIMNRLALYVFPLGVVVGGPFLPLAIILYWFANNIWTFGQQHYVFGKIAQEEEAKKEEAIARRAANAPPAGCEAETPRRSSRRLGERDRTMRGDRGGHEIPSRASTAASGQSTTDPNKTGSATDRLGQPNAGPGARPRSATGRRPVRDGDGNRTTRNR